MAKQKVHTGTFYHYTSTAHLPFILQDGAIRRTESNVGAPDRWGVRPAGPHAGPDVVWLFSKPLHDDDQTPHGLDGAQHDKRAVRFTVHTRATQWVTWHPVLAMHALWRKAVIDVGGGHAAARKWWVAERDIRRDDWLKIEMRVPDGTWQEVSNIVVSDTL